jgi:hypothetical protein
VTFDRDRSRDLEMQKMEKNPKGGTSQGNTCSNSDDTFSVFLKVIDGVFET